jgi:hypothetical protein
MADPYEATTLTEAMDNAARCGFTEQFTLSRGRLRAVTSGEMFAPNEVTIAGFYRFEGVSDPDDMAILYTIRTSTGVRGTLTDAFGVYSDPAVGAFMHEVALNTRRAA